MTDRSVNYEGSEMAVDRQKQKRKKIIKAAEWLFSRNGFHGTEVEQIARRAGLAKGTVYNYFKNKEDILISVIESGFEQLDRKMRSGLKGVSSPVDRLKRGIEIYGGYLKTRQPLVRMLLGEKAQLSFGFKKRFHDIAYSHTNHIEKTIREAIDMGLMKDLDPYVAATCLIGMMDMLYVRETIENKNIPSEVKHELVTEIFMEGMLA